MRGIFSHFSIALNVQLSLSSLNLAREQRISFHSCRFVAELVNRSQLIKYVKICVTMAISEGICHSLEIIKHFGRGEARFPFTLFVLSLWNIREQYRQLKGSNNGNKHMQNEGLNILEVNYQ